MGVLTLIKPRREVFLTNQWIILSAPIFDKNYPFKNLPDQWFYFIPGYLIIIFHTQRFQNRYYHNWGRCILLVLQHAHLGNLGIYGHQALLIINETTHFTSLTKIIRWRKQSFSIILSSDLMPKNASKHMTLWCFIFWFQHSIIYHQISRTLNWNYS